MRKKNINDFTELGFKRFLKKVAHLASIAGNANVDSWEENFKGESLIQHCIITMEGTLYVSFLVDKYAKYTILRESIQIGKTHYEYFDSVDYETFTQKDLYRFYMVYEIIKNRINQKNKERGIKK